MMWKLQNGLRIMARCGAASAGGGFIYKCKLEPNHPYNHEPEVYNLQGEKVEEDAQVVS
jgi:hypothetical protein